MSTCTLTAPETDAPDAFGPQANPDWQVAALSDPKLVTELADRLRAEGVAERRLVAVGPSAFLLFWR
jgi:hypothetical protein